MAKIMEEILSKPINLSALTLAEKLARLNNKQSVDVSTIKPEIANAL